MDTNRTRPLLRYTQLDCVELAKQRGIVVGSQVRFKNDRATKTSVVRILPKGVLLMGYGRCTFHVNAVELDTAAAT